MPWRTDPILRVGAGRDEWILVLPLVYESLAGETYVVPPGFPTDLASIPRVAQPFIPVNGKHRAGAILHDWLYDTQTLSRADADALFLESMEESGVSWIGRHAMYAAVRIGGWLPWGRVARAMQG